MKKTKLILTSLLSIVLVVSACSSGDPERGSNSVDQAGGGGGSEPVPGPDPAPEPLTPAEITAGIFAGLGPDALQSGETPGRASGIEMIAPEVVAETSGRIESRPNPPAVAAQFAAVEAYSDRTLVRYSLRSANGEKQSLPTIHSLNSTLPSSYLDGVALIEDQVEKTRFFPLNAEIPGATLTKCLCSPLPNGFTPNDHWFYGFYPALDPSVKSVKIELAGLEPTEVPVVWKQD